MCERCLSEVYFVSPCACFPELSIEGEKYVDEAVRKALYGVKQMKDIMAKNEEKHEHLMKSLKHSSDKKKVRETCQCYGNSTAEA